MQEQDIGSGLAGRPGVAFDAEKLGEPGQPGVPTEDQYPTNEFDDDIEEKGGSADIEAPKKK
ncbi:MAG: hypothetical protein ACRDRA_08790 [Pseudonocardiaceae bacterium]